MVLDLNIEGEYIQIDGQSFPLYREFFGPIVHQMPILSKSGRESMSIADVLKRRYAVQDAPENVKAAWHDNYFFTNIGNHRFRDGSAKLVLHDDYLIGVDAGTPLNRGAAILSDEQWESLTGNNVLYLSPERVKEIDRKKYTRKSIRDSPEWNFFFEGDALTLKTVTEYLFSEVERRFQYTESLGIYFDEIQDAHTNRALYVDWLEYRSQLWCGLDLDVWNGRLVGYLAPDALHRQARILEEKLKFSPKK